MKLYALLFLLLTLAEAVFTAFYYFTARRAGRTLFLGLLIYFGAMVIAYIAYEVEKYRRRKKELIDSLP